MQITNLNPDSDIGASAWLVELDNRRLLMDGGVTSAVRDLEKRQR